MFVNPNEMDKNNKIKIGSDDETSNNRSGYKGEKRWNQINVLQESKLEVTDCSINQSNLSMDADQSPIKKHIHNVDLFDYFGRKSEMPKFSGVTGRFLRYVFIKKTS